MPIYALIDENNIVQETRDDSPLTMGNWVEVSNHDCHGWTYNNGILENNKPVPADPTPLVPEAYRGLGFSQEDIDACEAGEKTIEQVQAEMSA